MSRATINTALPLPPKEYSVDYMNRLIRQLFLSLQRIDTIGPITCGSDFSNAAGYPISGLTIVNVPTSPDDLPPGSVWSDGGTLKIVS